MNAGFTRSIYHQTDDYQHRSICAKISWTRHHTPMSVFTGYCTVRTSSDQPDVPLRNRLGTLVLAGGCRLRDHIRKDINTINSATACPRGIRVRAARKPLSTSPHHDPVSSVMIASFRAYLSKRRFLPRVVSVIRAISVCKLCLRDSRTLDLTRAQIVKICPSSWKDDIGPCVLHSGDHPFSPGSYSKI